MIPLDRAERDNRRTPHPPAPPRHPDIRGKGKMRKKKNNIYIVLLLLVTLFFMSKKILSFEYTTYKYKYYAKKRKNKTKNALVSE